VSAALLAWLFIAVAPAKVFVGGHYPTDILVGLVLGLVSYQLSRFLMKFRPLVTLAASQWRLLQVLFFLWLFEVGNECRNIKDILVTLWHVRKHL
jgi:hypothetical protein